MKEKQIRKPGKHAEQTESGIWYDWSLAGPGGAEFILYKYPHNTLEQVERARKQLKNERDVVRLRIEALPKVITKESWDEFKCNSMSDISFLRYTADYTYKKLLECETLEIAQDICTYIQKLGISYSLNRKTFHIVF